MFQPLFVMNLIIVNKILNLKKVKHNSQISAFALPSSFACYQHKSCPISHADRLGTRMHNCTFNTPMHELFILLEAFTIYGAARGKYFLADW